MKKSNLNYLKLFAKLFLAMTLLFFVIPNTAYADTITAPSGSTGLFLGLNTAGVISFVIGTVLPLVVGLVTKQSMNAGVKAAILAALSLMTSVLTQWLDAINNNQHFAWQQVVVGAAVTWALGELTYLKLWKPSGVATALQTKGVADKPDNTNYDYLDADYANAVQEAQKGLDNPPSDPVQS